LNENVGVSSANGCRGGRTRKNLVREWESARVRSWRL
jgi:hypothetical protein